MKWLPNGSHLYDIIPRLSTILTKKDMRILNSNVTKKIKGIHTSGLFLWNDVNTCKPYKIAPWNPYIDSEFLDIKSTNLLNLNLSPKNIIIRNNEQDWIKIKGEF